MKDVANHKVGDIHGLKHEPPKWVANDLCKSITRLLNLVAKEGFSISWTINTIQLIFKSGERHSPGTYRTIMLGTIFGKLYGYVLEKEKKLVVGQNGKGSEREDKQVSRK